MVTMTHKPLFAGLKSAAAGLDNSQFGKTQARHMLDGLNATFENFHVRINDRQILAEAILRWRILKDAFPNIPANDPETKRLFQYDDYLATWLRKVEMKIN